MRTAKEARAPDPGIRPRCALRVAVVGNRRLGPEDDAQVAGQIAQHATDACRRVWQVIGGAMSEALELPIPASSGTDGDGASPPPTGLTLGDFFLEQPPVMAVLSSLAAGADQIGALTALEVGASPDGRAEVALDAVLPFGDEDYPGPAGDRRDEFSEQDAALLKTLSARARQVVHLDGDYGSAEGRLRAYRRCRDLLLQAADVVVAIFDPRAEGHLAGTRETVRQALAARRVVVAVLVTEGGATVAVDPDAGGDTDAMDLGNRAHPIAAEPWRHDVRRQVFRLLALPHQLAEDTESSQEARSRLQSLDEAIDGLRLAYGDTPPHRLCRSAAWQWVFGRLWRATLWTGRVCATSHGTSPAGDRHLPDADAVTVPPYDRLYARATELAHCYMRTYRGAFVGAFLAAALAAASAVGMLTAMLWWESLEAVPWWCLYPLGLTKIVILLELLRLERAALAGRIQEHATDFRYLAELTRPMQWLAPLGAVVPAVEPPTEATPDTWRGWTSWLMRAWSRSAPLVADPSHTDPAAVPARVSLDGGRTSRVLESARLLWVGGQIDYHRRTARTMHDLESGLEWIARRLVWIVLASGAGALVIEAGLRDDVPLLTRWLASFRLEDMHGLHGTAFVLGAMAAALPAFIAALAGILFQSEARRLRLRSQAMKSHLEVRDERLRSLAATLEDPTGPRGDDDALVAEHLRLLSVLVLSETGGWTILYQTHDIRAG